MEERIRIDGAARQELTSDAQAFYERYWVAGSAAAAEALGRHSKLLSIFLPVPPQGLRILEVGVGGEGGMIRLLKDTNDVVGVDASQVAVDICQRGGMQVLLSSSDREPLPFEENYFDIVFACEVFEHFSNPQFALEQIQTVLKPQGMLFITTPHPCIQHWPRLFYPSLMERPAFREFLLVNKFQVLQESNFETHPFHKLDHSGDAAWSWLWSAANVKSGHPNAIFQIGKYFWQKRDSRGVRNGAIEAADLFRSAFREDPELAEAEYALTLALCYRLINGEREEFERGWVNLNNTAANTASPYGVLARQYRQLILAELAALGIRTG